MEVTKQIKFNVAYKLNKSHLYYLRSNGIKIKHNDQGIEIKFDDSLIGYDDKSGSAYDLYTIWKRGSKRFLDIETDNHGYLKTKLRVTEEPLR